MQHAGRTQQHDSDDNSTRLRRDEFLKNAWKFIILLPLGANYAKQLPKIFFSISSESVWGVIGLFEEVQCAISGGPSKSRGLI